MSSGGDGRRSSAAASGTWSTATTFTARPSHTSLTSARAWPVVTTTAGHASVRTADSRSPCPGRPGGYSGTATRPAASAPRKAVTYSVPCGHSTATRAPGSASAASRAATARIRRSSLRQVRVRWTPRECGAGWSTKVNARRSGWSRPSAAHTPADCGTRARAGAAVVHRAWLLTSRGRLAVRAVTGLGGCGALRAGCCRGGVPASGRACHAGLVGRGRGGRGCRAAR